MENKHKYCHGCGEMKMISEFYKNEARADGIQVYCIDCQLAKKKRKKTLPPVVSRPKPFDGWQIFKDIYSQRELHDYLSEIANKKTKDKELRRDLVQSAWIRISFCCDTYDIDKIKEEGLKGINNEYKRVWNMRRNDLEFIETFSADEYFMWRRGFC